MPRLSGPSIWQNCILRAFKGGWAVRSFSTLAFSTSAEKHGIPFLKTWTVDKGEIPEDIQYPIITKAIISTLDNWKGDMIICHNENDLRNAYKVIRSPKVLLQKYIVKKNELCMEGISGNEYFKMFFETDCVLI